MMMPLKMSVNLNLLSSNLYPLTYLRDGMFISLIAWTLDNDRKSNHIKARTKIAPVRDAKSLLRKKENKRKDKEMRVILVV